MATSAETDFQKDIEALRADIAALTDTVGKLATEAVKAKSAIGGNMKTAAKKAGKSSVLLLLRTQDQQRFVALTVKKA